MLAAEVEGVAPWLGPHRSLDLAMPGVRLLEVREIGIQSPGDLATHGLRGAVGDEQVRVESGRADAIGELDVQRAVGNPALVAQHLISGLAAATAPETFHLRVEKEDLDPVGLRRRDLAEPRTLAVDLEPQGGEIAGLAEVEPGEGQVVRALAAAVGDQDRGAAPGIDGVRPDAHVPRTDRCLHAGRRCKGDSSAPTRSAAPPAGPPPGPGWRAGSWRA